MTFLEELTTHARLGGEFRMMEEEEKLLVLILEERWGLQWTCFGWISFGSEDQQLRL